MQFVATDVRLAEERSGKALRKAACLRFVQAPFYARQDTALNPLLRALPGVVVVHVTSVSEQARGWKRDRKPNLGMSCMLTIVVAINKSRVLLANLEKGPVEIKILAIRVPVLCGRDDLDLAVWAEEKKLRPLLFCRIFALITC